MTANQIAYAEATEAARHNKIAEAETERHNVATEQLEKEANDINDRRNSITEEYQNQKNAIDKDYNDKFLALQTSQGQQKIDIEKELASLEAEKARITANYNDNMVNLKSQENLIKERSMSEDIRHNKMQEELQTTYNRQFFALENKKAEYERTFQRETTRFRQAETRLKRREMEYDRRLRERQNLITESRFRQEAMESNARISREKAEERFIRTQSIWAPVTAIGSLLRGVSGLAK